MRDIDEITQRILAGLACEIGQVEGQSEEGHEEGEEEGSEVISL
jgi:hypothetical protein